MNIVKNHYSSLEYIHILYFQFEGYLIFALKIYLFIPRKQLIMLRIYFPTPKRTRPTGSVQKPTKKPKIKPKSYAEYFTSLYDFPVISA